MRDLTSPVGLLALTFLFACIAVLPAHRRISAAAKAITYHKTIGDRSFVSRQFHKPLMDWERRELKSFPLLQWQS